MKELCELYAAEIKKSNDVRAARLHPDSFGDPLDQLYTDSEALAASHILWMLEEIPEFAIKASFYGMTNEGLRLILKANRWLGFVQGWMWSNNICSINWLRESVKNHVS
jgi:hypothetical protein